MEGGIAIEVVFDRFFLFLVFFLFFKNFITFIHNLFSNCRCSYIFEKKTQTNHVSVYVCVSMNMCMHAGTHGDQK